jgi:hypothetical protein
MDKARFILCSRCDAVHHVTAFDKAPAYTFSATDPKSTPADDWRAFMEQHAGHTLQSLKAVNEPCFPSGLPADPMGVAYVKVTDGQREFLLRRSRRSIAEPVRFERIVAHLAEDPLPTL